MKTMMTLLALACLPHTAHTAQWRRIEHKPLPGQPLYPHDQLTEMAQPQGMPRAGSVSDIAERFGGSAKDTLRRPGKPPHLPQQTQAHPQPSAPQPPAYHEWLPLSPQSLQSPQSAPSDRSPSACSAGSRSSLLSQRTSAYREDPQPNYPHHFLHEPAHGWTSHSSQETHPSAPAVRPSAHPLEMVIPYVEGEEKLPDEVQKAIKNLRTQHQAFVALIEAAGRRGEQLIINRVEQQTATPPELAKWPFERQEHLEKRRRDALDTARTKATDKIGEFTDAMRVVCKKFPTK